MSVWNTPFRKYLRTIPKRGTHSIVAIVYASYSYGDDVLSRFIVPAKLGYMTRAQVIKLGHDGIAALAKRSLSASMDDPIVICVLALKPRKKREGIRVFPKKRTKRKRKP